MIYLGIGVGDGQTKAQFRRVYTGIGIVRRGGRTRSTGKAPPPTSWQNAPSGPAERQSRTGSLMLLVGSV